MANADASETVVWQLKANRSTARCVIERLPAGTLLTLLHDGEVVSRETFPTPARARVRAARLLTALQMKGWRVDCVADAPPPPPM